MTIEMLIEKLRKEYGENGIYAVMREHYKNIKEHENGTRLRGMIWGLGATNYITEEELNILLDESFEKEFRS